MSEQHSKKLADLGHRIRQARDASGLNLHELARLSGISAPALSRIETGQRDLRITSLYRIAAALRIQARDLVDPLESRPSADEASDGRGYDLTDHT